MTNRSGGYQQGSQGRPQGSQSSEPSKDAQGREIRSVRDIIASINKLTSFAEYAPDALIKDADDVAHALRANPRNAQLRRLYGMVKRAEASYHTDRDQTRRVRAPQNANGGEAPANEAERRKQQPQRDKEARQAAQQKVVEASRGELTMLLPRIQYARAREPQVQALCEVLNSAIRVVVKPDQLASYEASFKRFVELFEAIVAYHQAALQGQR